MTILALPKIARISKEEKGQFLRLAKHFSDRFFQSELVSPNAESRLGVAYVLPVLAVPGLLISFRQIQKYAYLAFLRITLPESETFADKCLVIALSMIIMGFISVLEWDLLFPDRKDFVILTPLPIRVRTMFTAKLAALLVLLCVSRESFSSFCSLRWWLGCLCFPGSSLCLEAYGDGTTLC